MHRVAAPGVLSLEAMPRGERVEGVEGGRVAAEGLLDHQPGEA